MGIADGWYWTVKMRTIFWNRNESLVRCIRILPFEDSLFLCKIGKCHHRSKTRYEGAIVNTERLAETRTVEYKQKRSTAPEIDTRCQSGLSLSFVHSLPSCLAEKFASPSNGHRFRTSEGPAPTSDVLSGSISSSSVPKLHLLFLGNRFISFDIVFKRPRH